MGWFARKSVADAVQLTDLLAEARHFSGTPAPSTPRAAEASPARAPRTRYAPRRGWSGPNTGRAAAEVHPTVYRADTGGVCGLYPFLHGDALPPIGAYIGWNTLTMQSFAAHPTAWIEAKLVTNPNVCITGLPGAGKSATVKALGKRLLPFGVKMLIAGDVKGEYNPLCRWLGVEPVILGPGMPGRLNPLAAGPLGADLAITTDLAARQALLTEIHRRRLALLAALIAMGRGRPVAPEERSALSVAIHHATGALYDRQQLTDPTLPQVYAALRDPTHEMADELRIRDGDIQELRESTASVRASLADMVTGHLGGLFDAETSTRLDFDAPIQSVDISRMRPYGMDVVAMVLSCVSSWAQAAIDQPNSPLRYVVRDEVWMQLRAGGAEAVGKVDSDLRLSRNDGAIQVLATHRLADFESVGPVGSAAAQIARDLISSCETRVTLAQDTKPLGAIKDAVGLTDAACAHISSWGAAERGRAMWKVGTTGPHIPVQLHLSALERQLFHTDERMGT